MHVQDRVKVRKVVSFAATLDVDSMFEKLITYALIGRRKFGHVQKWTDNYFMYEDVSLTSFTEVFNKTLQNLTKPVYLESVILLTIQKRPLLLLGIRNWLHHETDVGS